MIAATSLTLRQAYALFTDQGSIQKSTRRRHEYELRRWEWAALNPFVQEVSGETVGLFLRACEARGIGAVCRETTLDTMFTVLRRCVDAGLILQLPPRPKRQHEQPRKTKTINLADFNRFVNELCHTRDWPVEKHRAYFGLLYFSALRNADSRALTWGQLGSAGIPVRASKTGKLVTLAVHPILERLLAPIRGPDDELAFGVHECTIRRNMKKVRKSAGVQQITPQAIRKLSARMFERAHPGAGRLILGHALPGASGYYLAEEEILAMACEKLPIPECFLLPGEKDAAQWRERLMVNAFRGLRPGDQETALRLLEGMRQTVGTDPPHAA